MKVRAQQQNGRTSYRPHSGRRPTLELLERRDLLSVAPTVVDVSVASTDWTPAFMSYLESSGMGANGYSIPVGSTSQTQTLSWNNIDQIVIKFNEDVFVDAEDLSLSGVNVTAYEFADFFYDPQLHLATWTLAAPLENDRYLIDLDADGMDPVRNLQGVLLDGEWTDNVDTYASGDGIAGGDFEFQFTILPGDIDGTAQVTYMDYYYTRFYEGYDTSDPEYVAARDIDGSGVLEQSDWESILDELWETPPSGDPAGVGNDAPTTAGLAAVQIDDDAVDVAVGLLTAFDDDGGGEETGLTYSIQSNDNASLFDEAYIDDLTGELILNTASGASGRAHLVVRATDSAGLFVDTSVTVDVDYENQAPVIQFFGAMHAGGDFWVISGTVTDADDDTEGLLVYLSGVFEDRVVVRADGTFAIAVIVDPEDWAYETAITYDWQGVASDEEWTWVGLS